MNCFFDNIIYQGDILSFNPELCYNGHPRYISNIGLFFSILLYIATVGFIIYFFISFVDGNKMNVIESEEYNFDSRIKIHSKFILVKIADLSYYPIPEGIFNLFAFYITESSGEEEQMNPMELKVCNESDFTEHELKQINANISTFKCLSLPENEDLELKYQKDPYTTNYLRIAIAKCSPDSYFNNINCLSEEEINNYIENNVIIFDFLVPADYTDHKSTDNPILRSYKKHFKYVPKGLSYSTVKLKKMFYTSDDGLLFTKNKYYEGVNIYEIQDTSQEHYLPNEYYGDVHYNLELISSDYFCIKLHRSYDKFQDFLATIGGILNLCYYFFRILTYLITRGLFFRDLILLPTIEKYSMIRKNKSKEISEFILYTEDKINKNNISVLPLENNTQLNTQVKPHNQSNQELSLNNKRKASNLINFPKSNVSFLNNNSMMNKSISFIGDPLPSTNISKVKKKINLLSEINFLSSFTFSFIPCCIRSRKIYLLNNLGKIISYYLSSDELVYNTLKFEMLIQNIKGEKDNNISEIDLGLNEFKG